MDNNINDNNDINDDNNKLLLPISLIHYIFDYIDFEFKLLIHKEGSTDEDRTIVLSIKLIIISGLEEYFKDVLLSLKFKAKLCRCAARYGQLNCLIWALEHGCPWDSRTCNVAVKNGHLNILQWAREHGCPWDINTCTYAAEAGKLNCLIWAVEHGCPWNSYTCTYAAQYGHLNCLIWAIEHGCPWDRNQCLKAAEKNPYIDVIEWINNQPI